MTDGLPWRAIVLAEIGQGDAAPRMRSLAVTVAVAKFFFTQKNIRGTLMGDVQDLQWGLELVKRGLIVPKLDRTLPLAQAAEAHRLIANDLVRGNLVLLPWAS